MTCPAPEDRVSDVPLTQYLGGKVFYLYTHYMEYGVSDLLTRAGYLTCHKGRMADLPPGQDV